MFKQLKNFRPAIAFSCYTQSKTFALDQNTPFQSLGGNTRWKQGKKVEIDYQKMGHKVYHNFRASRQCSGSPQFAVICLAGNWLPKGRAETMFWKGKTHPIPYNNPGPHTLVQCIKIAPTYKFRQTCARMDILVPFSFTTQVTPP